MFDDQNVVESFVEALGYQGDMSFADMMGFVLAKARRVTSAEAGSIFVRQPILSEGRDLKCLSVQNDKVSIPAEQFTIPIDPYSIAGYIATNGEFLHIADLYQLDTAAPYKFNPSFDKRYNYTSRSMLAFPLKNVKGSIMGVIQLLNHIDGVEEEEPVYKPFPIRCVEDMKKLALMIGMVVERAAMIEEIERLGGKIPEARKTLV